MHGAYVTRQGVAARVFIAAHLTHETFDFARGTATFQMSLHGGHVRVNFSTMGASG